MSWFTRRRPPRQRCPFCDRSVRLKLGQPLAPHRAGTEQRCVGSGFPGSILVEPSDRTHPPADQFGWDADEPWDPVHITPPGFRRPLWPRSA